MSRKPKKLLVLSIRVFVWAITAVCFFTFFSFRNPYVVIFNRTSVIIALSYTVVYVLMTNVYGGCDIGLRKSRTIVFSMAMTLFFSDIIAHLFMCIMDVTVINGGRFVYEWPLLLLAVFVAQLLITSCLVYFGNWVYFSIQKPQNCLVIVRRGDAYEEWLRKVMRFKKQYDVRRVAFAGDPNIFEYIDEAEAVFTYNMAESERDPYLTYAYQQQKDIYYSMELMDVVMLGGRQIYFDDTALLFAAADKMPVENQFLKRLMDIVISLAGIIITSPVLLVSALAIKLEDGGDVFYRQKRATVGGRLFNIVKFRSMRQEVGEIHRSVTDDDDRITRVGRVIRRFRIDELPQLFNVLKGDMSIVGPRPEMIENVEKYTQELPQFSYRLRAKAGLTGLAQVYGRYNTTPKDKLILDMIYIENYSIWLDFKIILRTILVLFTPDRSTEAFSSDAASGGGFAAGKDGP